MKIFVYKTIFVLIGIYILYQLTIGIKISSYERNLKNLTNDQGREMIRNKIRDEIKKAKSLFEFKEQIKKWKPVGCTCRLCKSYVQGMGYGTFRGQTFLM